MNIDDLIYRLQNATYKERLSPNPRTYEYRTIPERRMGQIERIVYDWSKKEFEASKCREFIELAKLKDLISRNIEMVSDGIMTAEEALESIQSGIADATIYHLTVVVQPEQETNEPLEFELRKEENDGVCES